MFKLKNISGEEVIRRLEKLGFYKVRQRGSHVVLKKQPSEGEIICVVPLHKELAIGTLRGILRQAKLTIEEFLSCE
jgi:predicted RNA binding protein YcfA (HicA-like mRNA interferase family)